MDQQATIQDIDALLLPFLYATDEPDSERLLALLFNEHVEPIINKIIKSKLRISLSHAQGSERNQDALEIVGDLRAVMLSELRRLKADPRRRMISNLHQYVAIKTYSACADYFREKSPQRWRLKNSLRHHLKQNPDFALWESEDHRWLCGLSAWRDAESIPIHSKTQLQQLRENPRDVLLSSLQGAKLQAMQPADLLTAVFERVEHPIELDQLVSIAVEVWGVRDQSIESFDDEGNHLRANLADTGVRVDESLEQRLYLEKLWTEVCELPRLQRAALLLNLRDAQGGSVISFIPHLRIASMTQIAETLSMSNEEFAALWNELPLEDASIARLLGVTRQQVINLRKTARERLARRMKARDKN